MDITTNSNTYKLSLPNPKILLTYVLTYISPRSIGNLFSWGPVATDNYYYRETRHALGPLSNITVKQPMEYIKTLMKMDVPIIIGKECDVVWCGVVWCAIFEDLNENTHMHARTLIHTYMNVFNFSLFLFLPDTRFSVSLSLSTITPISHTTHTLYSPLTHYLHPSHTLTLFSPPSRTHTLSTHQALMSTKEMSSSSLPSHLECQKYSTKPVSLDFSIQVHQAF